MSRPSRYPSNEEPIEEQEPIDEEEIEHPVMPSPFVRLPSIRSRSPQRQPSFQLPQIGQPSFQLPQIAPLPPVPPSKPYPKIPLPTGRARSPQARSSRATLPPPPPEPEPEPAPYTLEEIGFYRRGPGQPGHVRSLSPYSVLQRGIYPSPNLHTQILDEFVPEIEQALRKLDDQRRSRHVISGYRSSFYYYERLRTYLNELPRLKGDDLARVVIQIIDDLPDSLRDQINDRYISEGYSFHYFGWIDRQHPYVKAQLGRIPLTPATFEVAATLPLVEYQRLVDGIEDGPEARHGEPLSSWVRHGPTKDHPNRTGPFNLGHFGWDKRVLQQAIIGEIKRVGLPMTEFRIGRSGHRLNVPTIALDAIFPGTEGILPGVINRSAVYLSKRGYLETVYRKLAHTLSRLNWSDVCANRAVPLNTLRFVAVNDFGLDLLEIRPLSYRQLCEQLQQESQRRQTLRRQLGEELPEVAPAIIYQPGSQWVQPSEHTRRFFKPVARQAEQFPEAYAEILQSCRDLSNVPKGYLIFLISRLGAEQLFPHDLTQISKETICRTLINYLRVMRGQR